MENTITKKRTKNLIKVNKTGGIRKKQILNE